MDRGRHREKEVLDILLNSTSGRVSLHSSTEKKVTRWKAPVKRTQDGWSNREKTEETNKKNAALAEANSTEDTEWKNKVESHRGCERARSGTVNYTYIRGVLDNLCLSQPVNKRASGFEDA